ncbi:MAG: hypothetical protein MHM6MM_007822 [Cercozoa sp. M6MM]
MLKLGAPQDIHGVLSVPKSVQRHIDINERQQQRRRRLKRDKHAERATTDMVLDGCTKTLLSKLLNTGVLQSLDSCISTGKEANVYHGKGSQGQHVAVKIYKTSVLSFRDRDRYVGGDWRFRGGYCKSNARKMVEKWAEKEMRNLKRLERNGVPAPTAFVLRKHVLVMDFVGDGTQAAPRLADADMSESRWRDAYVQTIRCMRTLFRHCRLVHGDLSEYNMLYHEKQVVFIDVSQSVDHEHPRAREFLVMDCVNVTHFFQRKGVVPMTVFELFEFVSSENITDDMVDDYLREMRSIVSDRIANKVTLDAVPFPHSDRSV